MSLADYATMSAPYVLRATRIVVVYHSSYRYKYAKLVKWRNIRKAWMLIGLFVFVLAVTLFATSARLYR